MPHRRDVRSRKLSWEQALYRSGLMDMLAAFDPHVVGTLPLGVSVPGSDIDIVCHAADPAEFSALLWRNLRHRAAFGMRQWIAVPNPVIVSFTYLGWPFEIYGADQPVRDQPGWRHFMVEKRLLTLAAASFRDAVMRERRKGAKTEAAFATVLGLTGDPYEALYGLSAAPDPVLIDMLISAGYATGHRDMANETATDNDLQ
ncbi:DUF4269 domain-containing protein [Sphingobium phenoxybenzoativorans]|uniref:DUF4269 domain-containing protein n=1 Tax=Sphingobium phenoxybenzoativorans TaxID=1592790 RepID=A0A975KC77_9SPHN|nr:DUF4269 domain-containing protein [Sphingobium phenoxybenzoativorans]QUT07417.1 DUF4269 domain-containing protein [Sphingobium phenoxybenzoativorans]